MKSENSKIVVDKNEDIQKELKNFYTNSYKKKKKLAMYMVLITMCVRKITSKL